MQKNTSSAPAELKINDTSHSCDMKKLGRDALTVRESLGLDREIVAKKIGLSKSTYAQFETGGYNLRQVDRLPFALDSNSLEDISGKAEKIRSLDLKELRQALRKARHFLKKPGNCDESSNSALAELLHRLEKGDNISIKVLYKAAKDFGQTPQGLIDITRDLPEVPSKTMVAKDGGHVQKLRSNKSGVQQEHPTAWINVALKNWKTRGGIE